MAYLNVDKYEIKKSHMKHPRDHIIVNRIEYKNIELYDVLMSIGDMKKYRTNWNYWIPQRGNIYLSYLLHSSGIFFITLSANTEQIAGVLHSKNRFINDVIDQ